METLISTRPRLAFCGVGWIGRNRMKAAAASGLADILMVADPSEHCIAEAQKIVPVITSTGSIDEVLEREDIDAVVIATPSAFHMEQAIQAFENNKAVFCQKPLGRNGAEVRKLIDASYKADRLLGADFSYRHTDAFKRIHSIIQSGALGKIFAVELKFHNAYGPDKDWFYDLKLSGGGCVLDLGIHMIDLMLFALDFPAVKKVDSQLYSKGFPCKGKHLVEDFANVQIETENDISVQLSCSWNLKAGCDAVIEATFFGTDGGVSMKNVNGSFLDFNALRFWGTKQEILSQPPDDWGGRALISWIKKLSENPGYDSEAENYYLSAKIVDLIYEK
jgi:predicted dehydrogenase